MYMIYCGDILCKDKSAKNEKMVKRLRRTFLMKKNYVEPTVLLLDYVVEDVMMASFNSNNSVDFPTDWWN